MGKTAAIYVRRSAADERDADESDRSGWAPSGDSLGLDNFLRKCPNRMRSWSPPTALFSCRNTRCRAGS